MRPRERGPRERGYCSICGGTPHEDGEELAGPPGHRTTYGRLTPIGTVQHVGPPPDDEKPADGPLWTKAGLPDGAPRNAAWLAGLDIETHVLESAGIWKGKKAHLLGVAGVVSGAVRFYASWHKDSKGAWKSEVFWWRDENGVRKTSWNELRGAVRERTMG